MRKVDPAALLVAVLAVGVSPMLEDGAWGLTNSIVAGVVLVVVLCFTWPRKPEQPGEVLPTKSILFAQSVVIGFIFAIGSAVIWQGLAKETHFPELQDCTIIQHADPVVQFWDTNNCEFENERFADSGTAGGLIAGGLIAGGFFVG